MTSQSTRFGNPIASITDDEYGQAAKRLTEKRLGMEQGWLETVPWDTAVTTIRRHVQTSLISLFGTYNGYLPVSIYNREENDRKSKIAREHYSESHTRLIDAVNTLRGNPEIENPLSTPANFRIYRLAKVEELGVDSDATWEQIFDAEYCRLSETNDDRFKQFTSKYDQFAKYNIGKKPLDYELFYQTLFLRDKNEKLERLSRIFAPREFDCEEFKDFREFLSNLTYVELLEISKPKYICRSEGDTEQAVRAHLFQATERDLLKYYNELLVSAGLPDSTEAIIAHYRENYDYDLDNYQAKCDLNNSLYAAYREIISRVNLILGNGMYNSTGMFTLNNQGLKSKANQVTVRNKPVEDRVEESLGSFFTSVGSYVRTFEIKGVTHITAELADILSFDSYRRNLCKLLGIDTNTSYRDAMKILVDKFGEQSKHTELFNLLNMTAGQSRIPVNKYSDSTFNPPNLDDLEDAKKNAEKYGRILKLVKPYVGDVANFEAEVLRLIKSRKFVMPMAIIECFEGKQIFKGIPEKLSESGVLTIHVNPEESVAEYIGRVIETTHELTLNRLKLAKSKQYLN